MWRISSRSVRNSARFSLFMTDCDIFRHHHLFVLSQNHFKITKEWRLHGSFCRANLDLPLQNEGREVVIVGLHDASGHSGWLELIFSDEHVPQQGWDWREIHIPSVDLTMWSGCFSLMVVLLGGGKPTAAARRLEFEWCTSDLSKNLVLGVTGIHNHFQRLLTRVVVSTQISCLVLQNEVIRNSYMLDLDSCWQNCEVCMCLLMTIEPKLLATCCSLCRSCVNFLDRLW